MAPRKGKTAARRCRVHKDRQTFREIVEVIPFDDVRKRLQLLAEQLSAPEVQAELQAADEEWLRLTGFDYPQSIEEYRTAGSRIGLTPEMVEFSSGLGGILLDYARGNYLRREDEARAREHGELRALAARRAAEASPPVIVDDEWSVIANGLSGHEPDVLVCLDAMVAHSAMAPCTKSDIASECGLTRFKVDRTIRTLRKKKLVESKPGRGSGGIRLTAAGRNVVARIPPDHVKAIELVNHQKAAQTLRRAQ